MKGLRFFIDHCVPETVPRELEKDGCQVFRLREHLPPNSPDPHVIEKAQDMDAALVSNNGDFADIVAYPPPLYKGIVALQIRNRPEAIGAILSRLKEYLHTLPVQGGLDGKLLLVEAHRIRIRY